MAEPISLGIAAVSLLLSLFTLWITTLRRGTIAMTRPTVVFFGPDDGGRGGPKVYFRTLLYSTSRRGQVIESLWVRLHRGGSVQGFNIWVYQEKNAALKRGSGLKIGYEGLTCTNHFLLPKDGNQFEFLSGIYRLEIYAALVNRKNPLRLFELTLNLSPEQTEAMKKQGVGVYFDWEPDARSYHSHVDLPRDGGYRPIT